MKRYRFGLEPVLRVRRIQEDVARAGFVAANVELSGAEVLLDATLDRYTTMPQQPGPRPSAAWLVDRSGLERTAASVTAAVVAREAARLSMEDQRRSLQVARVRVTGLERLDGRHRAEHAVAARRDEDAEADEQVSARHGRNT